MADDHLDRAEICELIVGTWAGLVGASPSERASKSAEIGKLLDRSADRISNVYSIEQKNRLLEVNGFLVQAGLNQMGSGNVWPDTTTGLYRTLLDDVVLKTLESLPTPADPENWVLVLEALLPVGRRFFLQRWPNKGRDEVERDLSVILSSTSRAWRWSSDNGEASFPLALKSTGQLVEGMMRRGQHAPFDSNEIQRSIDTVHYGVDRCVDKFTGGNPNIAMKKLEDHLKQTTKATLVEVLSLSRPPMDRNEIASMFEDKW